MLKKKNLVVFHVFIVLLILIYSCKDTTKGITFSNNKLLNGEPVFISEKLKKPTNLLVVDSFLIINNEVNDNLLLLININTGKCLKFGKKGEGPGESLSSWNIEYDDKHRNICIFDMVKLQYNLYNIDSIQTNAKYKPKQYIIKSNQGIPIHLKIMDSISFISTGVYNEGIVAIFNLKDSIFKFYGKPSGNINNLNLSVLNQAYSYIPTYNSEQKKIGLCTQNADQLIIFDSLLNTICDLRSFGKFDPIFSVDDESGTPIVAFSTKSIIGYQHICSSPKYIYGLFSGKNTEEGDFQLNIVHVFDWNGKPIANCELDRKVLTIAVDEKDEYIYGISWEREDPEILKFKL
jgi:hypothetical protein